MLLRFRLPPFSPKWIAPLLGVVGVVLLGVSVRGAGQRIDMLRSWPRVNARVDGGDVVSFVRRGQREAMYAGRLQLRYDFRGQQYAVAATEEVYSSHYAAQARGAQQATREGQVQVLLDPDRPAAPRLNAGYNAEFFFGSIVLAWIGGVLVFLAAVFSRAFRDEAPGTTRKQGGGAEGRWVAAFFAVLGIGFVAGGVSAFWFAQRELTTWRPVDARVDSTDVVWRPSRSRGSGGANSGSYPVDVYAARAWITYSFGDSEYHVPVVRGAYSNDSSGAARVAAVVRRSGSMSARVNPGNPFDAAVERPGAVRRFWFPALFTVPGLVCLVLVWVIGGRKRRPRRRAAAKCSAR